MEYRGGTRVKITHHHLAVDFTHDGNLVSVSVYTEVAAEGKRFEEGAALVGDGDGFTTFGTEEEYFEIGETYHDDGLGKEVLFGKAFLDGVLKLETGEACDVDLSKDRELDVAVDINEVGTAAVGGVAVDGVATDVEGFCDFLIVDGSKNIDVKFVVGAYYCLEFVFQFYLATVAHVLEVVDLTGGDARGEGERRNKGC